jgi:hypothetical protein
MPDLIRHPGLYWIPAFAGMTNIKVFCCRVNKITAFAAKKEDEDEKRL